jgi:mRNA interferase MazF
MYQQGDIVSVTVTFPFTDLSNAKLRPALVISNHSVNNTGDVIIVMITSKEKQDGLNISIEKEDADFEFPFKSFVRLHRIATVEHSIIQNKIGTANKGFIIKVIGEIKAIITHIDHSILGE